MDVRKAVLEYLDRQSRFKQAESEFSQHKKEFYGSVRRFLQKKGKSSFVFEDRDRGSFTVSDVRPKKVTFDAQKLSAALPLDVREGVILRKYSVDDWDGFSAYMGKLGADIALVMSFLNVEESVDAKALDEAIDSGKVKAEDIEGCYEVRAQDGYIRVTEMET